MEKVITADGSITFRNKDVDETYHSHSGAATEARLKYGEPSGIVELARKARHNTTIHILDFCFGLGYNTAAAIDMIREVNTCCQIDIIGLEIDQTILDTPAPSTHRSHRTLSSRRPAGTTMPKRAMCASGSFLAMQSKR